MIEFKGQRYEDLDLYPEGKYGVSLFSIEPKSGNWGNYISIKWEVMTPTKYAGRIIYDNFGINSGNETQRFKAVNALTELVEAYTGKQELNRYNWQEMLNQCAELELSIWEKPDGSKKNVIRSRIPKAHAKSRLVQAPPPQAQRQQAPRSAPAPQSGFDEGFIDDEVPFHAG